MNDTVTIRRVGATLLALGWIALVVTGWVVGLSLIFLATGWPRWAFYAAVIAGTLVFIQLVNRGE